jgi:7-cyano-7-deazaguanine reductase
MPNEPTYLGKQTRGAIDRPERVPTDVPHGMEVVLQCNEFTSHCPVTDQPDYATLTITYVPKDGYLAETKSVKLWLQSFRDRREFNEVLIGKIAVQFVEAIRPVWVRVDGVFGARGGISVRPSVLVYGPDDD